ncbi:type I-C CRISPR-associated protein Cas5c [Megalodesulfovibrio paquesii]
MPYGVTMLVWGERACFTRPEMKAERVSYDTITPSAARGVLEAIYWKPEIRWVVDAVTVLNPIRFETVRRNELGHKLPFTAITAAMRDKTKTVETFIEDDRQPRATLLLRDVRYRVEAHFEFTPKAQERNDGKHLDIFNRRLRDGACFHRPYLGCREFPAFFAPDNPSLQPDPSLTGTQNLGWMLHDLDYSQNTQEPEPRFFRATMVNGRIVVPPLKEAVA